MATFDIFQGPCFPASSPDAGSDVLCWQEKQRRHLLGVYQDACRSMVSSDAENLEKVETETSHSQDMGTRKPVVLIEGPSGSGKSELLKAFRQTVEQEKGVVIHLKHTNTWGLRSPHQSMLGALLDFASEAPRTVDSLALDRLRKRIRNNQKKDVESILTQIPKLRELLNIELSMPSFSSGEAHRLKDVDKLSPHFRFEFQSFLAAMWDPEHPLVVAIEDIQWASEATIDSIMSIVRDPSHGGIMVVCTFREDALRCESPDMESITKVWTESPDVDFQHIHLDHFSNESDLQQFLLTALGPVVEMESLAETVFESSRGQIILIDKTLFFLEKEGSLGRIDGIWRYTSSKQDYLPFSIQETFRDLTTLTQTAHEMLQMLISSGFNHPIETILSFGNKEVLDPLLQFLFHKGLLRLEDHGKTASFVHNYVQDYLYRALDPGTRDLYHYRLARRLWHNIDVQDLMKGDQICEIVDHFNCGRSLIQDPRERNAIGQLCLGAAKIGVDRSSFQSVSRYLQFGRSLLQGNYWEDNYDLTLDLYNASAELGLCQSMFDDVFTLTEEIIDNARTYSDSLHARASFVYALGTSGNPAEALNYACEVLSQLGVKLSIYPTMLERVMALTRAIRLMKGRTDESIRCLPPMRDHDKLQAMKLLSMTFVYGFTVNPLMGPCIAYEMIRLSILHGICSISGLGFVLLGALLCRLPGRVLEGYRYGKLALSIKGNVDIWSGRVDVVFYGGINGWRQSLRESFPYHVHAMRKCLLVGDRPFAMRIANVNLTCKIDLVSLPELAEGIRQVRATMKYFGDSHNLGLMSPLIYIVYKLSGRNEGNFKEIELEALKLETYNTVQEGSTNGVFQWVFYAKMMTNYVFGDYEEAYRCSQHCAELYQHGLGAGDTSTPFLFDGLVSLELAKTAKRSKRKKFLARAQERIKKIRTFASTAPFNFLPKQYLLEAEYAAVSGDDRSAYAKYASAIALSNEAGYFLNGALANERAGKYFFRCGDRELASRFLSEARLKYLAYGADCKVQHLHEEVQRLLY